MRTGVPTGKAVVTMTEKEQAELRSAVKRIDPDVLFECVASFLDSLVKAENKIDAQKDD